jgi:hypothetical protein
MEKFQKTVNSFLAGKSLFCGALIIPRLQRSKS